MIAVVALLLIDALEWLADRCIHTADLIEERVL